MGWGRYQNGLVSGDGVVKEVRVQGKGEVEIWGNG